MQPLHHHLHLHLHLHPPLTTGPVLAHSRMSLPCLLTGGGFWVPTSDSAPGLRILQSPCQLLHFSRPRPQPACLSALPATSQYQPLLIQGPADHFFWPCPSSAIHCSQHCLCVLGALPTLCCCHLAEPWF
jgi:hypothetical protein